MLTRDEIRNELLERKVNEKLVQMPAVMERMYEALSDLTLEDMKKNIDDFLSVEQNGSFKINDSKALFSIREDGSAVVSGIPYEDSIIHVNKEGIEVAYEDGDWMGRFSQISRKDGRIVKGSGNNGTGSLSETTYLDAGSWSILSQGAKIDEFGIIDEQSAISSFDTEAQKVMQEYPETSSWYEKARTKLLGVIQDTNDPEQRIKRLLEENEKLKQQKSDLVKRNGELATRLSATLDFAETVKRSPVGKVFFRKPIERLEGKEQSLPAGKDDR